ncbi:hypothetical protein AC579_2439 [Pseudocercospora musae]|uniref:Uncharacterized protein n=1 Tax=Pseudocercospora musae TaxID=113226 RepID=A0A139HZ65_9PEZI|nr:hypothetical protein AC579_2439 [Pseudocercospora musae]
MVSTSDATTAKSDTNATRQLLDALAVKAVQRIVASRSDGTSNTPTTDSSPELEGMSMGAERGRIDESAQQIWDGFGDFDLDSFTRHSISATSLVARGLGSRVLMGYERRSQLYMSSA